MTRGRFGNKILQYNSLMQLASLINESALCVPWQEGNIIFNLPVADLDIKARPEKLLTWQDCINRDWNNIKKLHSEFDLILDDPAYILHNVFFHLTHKDPREFFHINNNYKKILPTDKLNIGIHLRGADILGGDRNHGREIHKPEYYKKSIDLIESKFDNTKYYVCTDDLNFNSYKDTITYLEYKNCQYGRGDINNYFEDFSTLSECDILIASSSTFVICAGFLGKPYKKIIHSKEWVNKNLNHTLWHPQGDPPDVRKFQQTFDQFWIDLYNEDNDFYNVWKWV